MLVGSGLRARHDGRQKMPVVRTAVKKMPLYDASLARKARSISAREGSAGAKRIGWLAGAVRVTVLGDAVMGATLPRPSDVAPPKIRHQILPAAPTVWTRPR